MEAQSWQAKSNEAPATFAERFTAFADNNPGQETQTVAMALLRENVAAKALLPKLTLNLNELQKGQADLQAKSVVVVDKSSHRTRVLQMNDGKIEEVLNVPDATGKGPRMTPLGRFNIMDKEMNPTWYPPPSIGGRPVGPGPKNPLGVAKIRTDAGGGLILLHGTNRPDQIGMNASRGCVRHHNQDILKIYPLVQKGDAVYIVNSFDGTKINPADFGPRKR